MLWPLVCSFTISMLEAPRVIERVKRGGASRRAPLQVSVQSSAHVWTEMQVDGRAWYSGWLEAGNRVDAGGRNEVRLWCGRADSLRVTVNGRCVGTLADYTSVPKGSPSSAVFTRADRLPMTAAATWTSPAPAACA